MAVMSRAPLDKLEPSSLIDTFVSMGFFISGLSLRAIVEKPTVIEGDVATIKKFKALWRTFKNPNW